MRLRLLLVIDEVRADRLTRVGAARALDMSLDEFLVEAGRHGRKAIDYDDEDSHASSGFSPHAEQAKATIAVAASLLTAAYFMPRDGVEYADLGGTYFAHRDVEQTQRRLLRRLRDPGVDPASKSR